MKIKKSNKAFTLIELLVVVLIIGILAAIAVPQYQISVEKSRYSTLKAKTKALAQAINTYKLANGVLPAKLGDLDISFPDATSSNEMISFPNGEWCYFWIDGQNIVACFLKDNKMGFYFNYENLTPRLCYSLSNNTAGLKVCEQETGESKTPSGNYTIFNY